MPVFDRDPVRIDYAAAGSGPAVVLVHSSVSGNRQWRRLTEALADRYRVLAINLHGYGETSPWRGPGKQTLAAQAALIEAMLAHEGIDAPARIVGHSYGGAVAMKAAARLGGRAAGLVLIEPNPFYLLRHAGRTAAFDEVRTLRDLIAEAGDDPAAWDRAGQAFCDYWMEDGAWATMPDDRKRTFLNGLRATYHEWDGVTDEAEVPLEGWGAIAAETLVLCSAAPRRPIAEIADMLLAEFPHWRRAEIPEGGHMAPLTRPDIVNPMIAAFLNSVNRCDRGCADRRSI